MRHVLCCAECFEPVPTEAAGNTLQLHCGYCGKDDVRELAPTPAVVVERAYRGRAPGEKRTPPGSLDLTIPPAGLERFRRVRARDREPLASEWKKALAGEHDRRVAYLGVTLSSLLEHVIHDALRARAVLETTLLHVQHPAIKALVAARLANFAARSGDLETAEAWLDRIPTALRVAEVESARNTTRAFLCRARKDWQGVLDIIGQRNTADDFVPPYRWLAVALRMDAHEQLGQDKLAYGVWNQLARGGGSGPTLASARASNLAPATRKRIVQYGFAALAVIFLMLCALATILLSITRGEPVAWWMVALGFSSFALLMIARWRMLP